MRFGKFFEQKLVLLPWLESTNTHRLKSFRQTKTGGENPPEIKLFVQII
jgi:hypothetical protein